MCLLNGFDKYIECAKTIMQIYVKCKRQLCCIIIWEVTHLWSLILPVHLSRHINIWKYSGKHSIVGISCRTQHTYIYTYCIFRCLAPFLLFDLTYPIVLAADLCGIVCVCLNVYVWSCGLCKYVGACASKVLIEFWVAHLGICYF